MWPKIALKPCGGVVASSTQFLCLPFSAFASVGSGTRQVLLSMLWKSHI